MYTFEMMPGPTDEARKLQLEQCTLLEKLYDAHNAAEPGLNFAERNALASVVAARQAYDESVTKLIEMLGSDVHCCNVDTSQWEFFSNAFKDDVGCRPHGFWTHSQVQTWLDAFMKRQEQPAEDLEDEFQAG